MQTLNMGIKEEHLTMTWRAGAVTGRGLVMEVSKNEKRHWTNAKELTNHVANE